MKNPASYIRQALVILLNGTVTYDGVQVPCYDGEGEVTPYQILLQGQVKTSRGNRDSFAWYCEQRIEVISEQRTSLHDHVDAIANIVTQLLKPTPRTSALTGNSEFQVLNVEIGFGNYIDEPSGDGTMINRLPLTINFFITQIHNN